MMDSMKKYAERALVLAEIAMEKRNFFEAAALYRSYLSGSRDMSDTVYLNLAWCYFNLDLGELAVLMVHQIGDFQIKQQAKYKQIVQMGPVKGNGLMRLSHHTYIRLKLLADKLKSLYGESLSSVKLLDLGGGSGYLACFLPEVQYFLADPLVNQISAFDLTNVGKQFDCVVACHVFEHVEKQEREHFLDILSNLAKDRVVLLNPFLCDGKNDGMMYQEALQIMFDITGEPWVKEHLEASTPYLSEIDSYASRHGYTLTKQPNNAGLFTALYVYMERFAQLAQRYEEFERINRFFNECDPKYIYNQELPNDYLCVIDLK